MTWHYLCVLVEQNGERDHSFCEVYLDEDGRVDAWTESRAIAPSGSTLAELQSDLEHMLSDLQRWEPGEFATLKRGMKLKAHGTESEGMYENPDSGG